MATPIRISRLTKPGQVLLLGVQGQGCFGGSHFQLKYFPQPQPRLHAVSESGTLLSAVLLSPAQVALLENLLTYYRSPKGDGCTTMVTLRLTELQQGKKVRTEMYTDASCCLRILEDAFPEDLKTLGLASLPVLSLTRAYSASTTAEKSVAYPKVPRKQTGAYQEVQFKNADMIQKNAEAIKDRLAHRLMVELKGYAKLQQQFHVTQVMLGDINRLPYSLCTRLESVAPRLVNAAWWFDPVVAKLPQFTWDQFLAVHQEVERVASHQAWLAEWKQAGKGRQLEAQIFGVRPSTGAMDDLQRYVIPAWKHAGLRGEPYYELLLRRTDDTWASVYLGRQESHALVVSARPPKKAKSAHWLDRMEFSYYPSDAIPAYVVVTPDGHAERNTRPK